MPAPRKVALHILDDCSLNRSKVLGVLEYLKKRPQWEIPLQGGFPYLPIPELLRWRGDGVIGNFSDHEVVRSLQDRGLAVVNTASGIDPSHELPTVAVDSERIASLAARHLIERKFRVFAFFGFSVGNDKRIHFLQREASFHSQIRAHGLSCRSCWANYEGTAEKLTEASLWKPFVRKLKRPAGIFACSDHAAFGVVQACREMDIRVPDEIAVIGVDDDKILCQLSVPRITSIDPRGEVVGYKAAEMLDRMFGQEAIPRLRQVVTPGEIHQRASTDIIATSNLEVVEALRFINSHAGENINVTDVLRVVTISRRSLERHFRETTGMGIYEAIRKAHIDIAKRYLRESGDTIDGIARRSGFSNAQRLNESFLAIAGMSASEYRDRS